jgi:hypothetical protein
MAIKSDEKTSEKIILEKEETVSRIVSKITPEDQQDAL